MGLAEPDGWLVAAAPVLKRGSLGSGDVEVVSGAGSMEQRSAGALDRLEQWRADGLIAAATILQQIGEQLLHAVEIGAVANHAAVALAVGQSCARQDTEVCRHRVLEHAEAIGNFARRNPFWSRLNEQAEHVEASLVGQGSEGVQRLWLVHASIILDALI